MPKCSSVTLCLSIYSNKPKNIKTTPSNFHIGALDNIICDAALYNSIIAQVIDFVSLQMLKEHWLHMLEHRLKD